jgi:hypothetical protein
MLDFQSYCHKTFPIAAGRITQQPNFTPRKEIAGACSNNSKSGGSMVRGASQRKSIAEHLRFVKEILASAKFNREHRPFAQSASGTACPDFRS